MYWQRGSRRTRTRNGNRIGRAPAPGAKPGRGFSPPRLKRRSRWRSNPSAVFLRLHVLGLLPALLLSACSRGDEQSLEEALSAALQDRRWIEPRVTGGGAPSPCLSSCGPSRLLCEPNCFAGDRHKFPSVVSREIERLSGNASLHAKAVLTLVSSREREAAESAVKMLQDLAELEPSDLRIWSDLSAAYFVRAQRGDQPSDLVWTLETAEKALNLGETREARFNQALALQALSLQLSARRAWDRCIELDPDSGWAEEARRRLRELETVDAAAKWDADKETIRRGWRNRDLVRKLVSSSTSAARSWVEEELLTEWADAKFQGLEDAALDALALSRVISRQLAELSGDRLLQDAVAAIERALDDESSVSRLNWLIEGHRAYGQAVNRFEDLSRDEANQLYGQASQAFARAKSPFFAWADTGRAACDYSLGRSDDALRLLASIERYARSRRYWTLLARAQWITGACRLALARPLEALESYQSSLKLFDDAGENANAINLHARISDALEGMGERQLAWRHRYRALRAAPVLREGTDSGFVFLDAGIGALGLDLPNSALQLLDESARRSDDAVLQASVLMQRANGHRRAEDFTAAQEDLFEASKICIRLSQSDKNIAATTCARIQEAKGLVELADSQPDAAYDSFTAALEWLEPTDERGYLAYIHLQRAIAARNAGRAGRAEQDLKTGKQMIEEEWDQVFNTRKRGENEDLWLAYFSSRRQIFDLLIDLLWRQGRTAEAFSIAEQAQARDLLDLIPGAALREPSASLRRFQRTARPLAAEEIRSRVKAGKALVAYRSLDDRLLIWLVRQGRIHAFEVDRSRHEIEALTEKIQEYTGRQLDGTGFRDLMLELHAVLVAQIRPNVEDEEELVFVPEGPIHGVPFAALRNPATGRYLIQDNPVSIAPSATLHVYSEQRNRALVQGSRTALLVGDPEFDKDLFPNLGRLEGAAAETERIMALYPGSAALTGAEANKPKVFALSRRHEILHFAGHARANPRFPSRSVLILAPSAEDSGALYGHELLQQDLSSVRLVVLSACSTAGGQPIGALGVSSLVRPFLAAGVPAVVGSLWDVGDEASRELLTEFHARFKQGDDAAAALRGAQLELLRGNRARRSPLSWAPFQVIGTASFRED